MPRVRPLVRACLAALLAAGLLLPARALAGAPARTGEPPAADPASLVRQRAVAYRMKLDAIWSEARAERHEARERAELVRRARRGDKAAIRGLRVTRANDEERTLLDEPLPPRLPAAPLAAAHTLVFPANARCNDPQNDIANAGQAEASVAAIGDQVVVAWNDGQGFTVTNGDVQGYGWSADGGLTFTDGGAPPHPPAYPGFYWTSDPVLTVNERTGDFWYCGLANPDPTHNAIAVARGRFSSGVFAFDSVFIVRSAVSSSFVLDKQWITCDSSAGGLYVTYTEFGTTDNIDFQRSTDGGRTWSAPVAISSAGDAGRVQGSRIVVAGDGAVHAAWYAVDAVTDEDDLRYRRSTNRGASFGAEVTPVKFNSQFGTGAPGFNRERGVNFPSLTVDRTTGPHRGRAYLAWQECWHFLGTALPPAGATNLSEVENNGSAAGATAFTPGQTLRGTLTPAGSVTDQDWFACPLAAGKNLVVWADSVTLGGWYLRLLAPDGVQRLCLGGNPSGGANNYAYWTFTAPVSGTYYLRMLEVSPVTIGYRIRTALGVRGSERGRDQRDAFVAWTDDGAAWSAPVRVNDDAVGYDNWLPELGAGSDGCVYATWYDHRDDPWGSTTNVYLSRSCDGGATWAASRAVSSAPSNFTTSGTNIAPNMGDYAHVASSGTKLYPVWADGRSVTSVDVWSAVVPLTAGIATTPPDTVVNAPGTATFGWTLTSDNPLFAGNYGVALSSERAWPLPAASSVTLGNGSSTLPGGAAAGVWWSADVVVPDTAASGPNRIGLTLTSPGGVVLARSFFTVTAAAIAVGVGGAPATTLSLGASRPNPAFGEARLAFTLPHAGRVRLTIYDLTGARVRTLHDGVAPAGLTTAAWDGRDERGRGVRAGAYFYRLEFEGQSLARRLVYMR